MSRTAKNLLVAFSFVVLVVTIGIACWLFIGSVVIASTGTLPGGWAAVWTELIGVLLGGITLADLLFWIAVRQPKPLHPPD